MTNQWTNLMEQTDKMERRVLNYLKQSGAQTVRDIASYLNIPDSQVKTRLKWLKRKNIVYEDQSKLPIIYYIVEQT